jgi:hypothetical protein
VPNRCELQPAYQKSFQQVSGGVYFFETGNNEIRTDINGCRQNRPDEIYLLVRLLAAKITTNNTTPSPIQIAGETPLDSVAGLV